jgi:hypothetical protein
MVQTYNNDTNVSGYYNKKYISREKNNLVSGQTVSQSDFLNSDSRHNAVKLFDKNINTSWKSQIKGGTYLDDINRRQKFKRNLYSKISTYHSIYSTPEIDKTNDSTYSLTKLNNDKGIHGSWAQVTYSRPLIAGSMYIQMEDRGDSYIEQMQTVKKLSIVASNQGDEIPDRDKKFDLITEIDYDKKYAQKFSFKVSSKSGGISKLGKTTIESFNVIANGQILETIKCIPGREVERTYYLSSVGLEDKGIIIDYLNASDFKNITNFSGIPGLHFSEFTLNDKPVLSYFKHGRNSNKDPIDGSFTKGGPYELQITSASNKLHKEKLPIPYNNFIIKEKPYVTYRLIIQELYGGKNFRINDWGITGKNVNIKNPDEGFYNRKTSEKQISNARILNSIYTNTPKIAGVSLIEGYQGTSELMDREESIIDLVNRFNEEYATYIRCNGLHLKDSERQNCVPSVNFYRLPRIIKIEFTVAQNLNSGSNAWNSFSFIGIPDGSTTNQPQIIGTPFNYTSGMTFESGSNHTIQLEYNQNNNKNELNGLEQFAGEFTGMELSFGDSKLEFFSFKVTIIDNRGKPYTFIDSVSNQLGQLISGNNWDDNRNDITAITGNSIHFYNNGLDQITSLHSQLRTELDSMTSYTSELNNAINLSSYESNHNSLKNSIKDFKELRYDLDTKLREIYMIEGSTSGLKKLQYDGTMFSGALWTVLATTILYYTLYELD